MYYGFQGSKSWIERKSVWNEAAYINLERDACIGDLKQLMSVSGKRWHFQISNFKFQKNWKIVH